MHFIPFILATASLALLPATTATDVRGPFAVSEQPGGPGAVPNGCLIRVHGPKEPEEEFGPLRDAQCVPFNTTKRVGDIVFKIKKTCPPARLELDDGSYILSQLAICG